MKFDLIELEIWLLMVEIWEFILGAVKNQNDFTIQIQFSPYQDFEISDYVHKEQNWRITWQQQVFARQAGLLS